MQHILNIAFDFDDDAIKKKVEKSIETDINNIIDTIIKDQIAPFDTLWYGAEKKRDWSAFNSRIDRLITSFLDEHREEVIERASDKLADSLKRTKAWKEKYSEIL